MALKAFSCHYCHPDCRQGIKNGLKLQFRHFSAIIVFLMAVELLKIGRNGSFMALDGTRVP